VTTNKELLDIRENVIRFLPPPTIETELMAEALEVTGNAIRRLAEEIRKAS